MTDIAALNEAILAEARRLHPQQVKFRRQLHQYPELSFEEHETTRRLTAAVKKIGLELLPIDMETGVLAELKGGKGRTVAIRTDIDALPVTEQTSLPFASKNQGKMHACGHDVHMATVYGVATLLTKFKEHLPGTVRFIFQPAEEHPPGGARPMIENGALNDVSAILGLHVEPHLRTGWISLRDGATMASVTDFDLIIRGEGGHAARPHLSTDAITTAADVISAVQKIVSRETDPIDPVVVTFGQIEGGVARNVIADEVRLVGTARTLSVRAAKKIAKSIKRVASNVCKAHNATLKMNLIADYPVLYNDARVNQLLRRNYDLLFGHGKVAETEPGLGGEDFACYLEHVPGAMFRLGVMNKKIKADKPWHSPQFIADEEAIVHGTALLGMAAIDVLNGGLRP